MMFMRVDLRHAQKSPRGKTASGVGPDNGLDGLLWTEGRGDHFDLS